MAITSWMRILASVGMIVFAGAITVGATGAFFSNTQTSTGNTFTAGDLKLTVDDTQHYDGLTCTGGVWVEDVNGQSQRHDLIGQPCTGTWTQGPLGPTTLFWNFTDIKPGDNGENTISLHVSNNAWICANIKNTSGTVLAGYTHVFGWVDNGTGTNGVAGDNKWQADEPVLFQPTALSAVTGQGITVPFADSTHGSALVASTTNNYIGLAWCTGTMAAQGGVITCDGSTVGNDAQSTTATADITLTAEQSRNNPSFQCVTP